MRILFLIYHGLSDISGISKKILNQVEGLKELGHDVRLCTYTYDKFGNKVRMVNDVIIENLGNGIFSPVIKRINYNAVVNYIIRNNIQFVYVRSFHNANPFTIHLFKSFRRLGVKSVIEIPTFPYDQEYSQSNLYLKTELFIDKLYRKSLAKQTDAIITFTDIEEIFGQKTIQISNGINFNILPLIQESHKKRNQIHLIGVAEVHFWHGYDRIINGIGEYYQEEKHPLIDVYFHIVGGIGKNEMYGSNQFQGFITIIENYDIKNHIIFHGQKFGSELDNIFNISDFAIGSLARHRTGITNIKTLKNREYAARGIPFIYSETDVDFDSMPYIIKAPADESPIDIQNIIDFKKNFNLSPFQIRDTIKELSWKNQMKKVINSIFNNE